MEAEKATCSSVEKSHRSIRIQNKNALFQRLKDVFQKPSFSHKAIHKRLNLARVQTVQPRYQFFYESGVQSSFAGCRGAGLGY